MLHPHAFKDMTDIERLTELFSQRELFENAFKEYFKAHFDWQIVTTFDKEDVKEDSIAIFFSEGAGRAEGESRNAPLTGGYREQGRFDCSLSIVVTSRRRNRDKRELDAAVAKLRGLMTRGMLFRSSAITGMRDYLIGPVNFSGRSDSIEESASRSELSYSFIAAIRPEAWDAVS